VPERVDFDFEPGTFSPAACRSKRLGAPRDGGASRAAKRLIPHGRRREPRAEFAIRGLVRTALGRSLRPREGDRFAMRVPVRPRLLVVFCLLVTATASRSGAADLCQKLVKDKLPHPMTPLAKPALAQTVIDPQFGTTLRRISAVAPSGANPAIVPLYSTVSAWNADESGLILYHVGFGHELYDGHTYRFIRALDINPADVEQVYWHTSDPDVLFYASGNQLIRYHVGSGLREAVHTFQFCSSPLTGGSDPMFTSWSSNLIGLRCGNQLFTYRMDTDTVNAVRTSTLDAPQASPSGTMAFTGGYVLDPALNVLRQLDLANPYEHASLGRLASGHDTYNGVAFDPGPAGSGAGSLVTFDLTDGRSRVIVGPTTGFPYPPSGTHVSAMAYRQPGWVFLSVVGNPAGQNVLDNELVLADTNGNSVCRIGHHRSYGGNNTRLADSYWAEPHVVASPSGTRALFASDWGNGSTVDTYVAELPGYVPFQIGLSTDKPAYTPGSSLQASLTLANAGAPAAPDLYLLIVLPDGDQVVDFTDWSFHQTGARLSSPASLRPIQTAVSLYQPFTLNKPNFLGWTWQTTQAAGTYRLIMMTVRPGALADGRFDPGDVLSAGLASFTFTR
jgi:hypothetical protein